MTLIKPRMGTFMDSPCDLNGIPIPRYGVRSSMPTPVPVLPGERTPVSIEKKKMHWSLTEEWNFVWILFLCLLFFLYMTPVFVYDTYSYYVPEEAYGWRNPYVLFSLFSAFLLPLIIMEYVDMEQGKEVPWPFQPLSKHSQSLTGIQVVHFCVYLLTIGWIVKWTTYVQTLRAICIWSSCGIFLFHYVITSFLTYRIKIIY